MAQFCNKCGRPLPENGVCPCQTQQPQQQYQVPPQYQQPQYQQPAAPVQPKKPVNDASFGAAFADLFPFAIRSFKDPAGEIKRKVESKNIMFGIVVAILFAAAMLLTPFTRAIGASSLLGELFGGYGYGYYLGHFLLSNFATIILAVGAALGANILSCLIAKQKIDFVKILTGTLCSLLLPAVILVASILLNLVSPLAGLMESLAVLSMLLMNYNVSTKVLKADTFWTILIHIGLASLVTSVVGWVF